MLEGLHQQTNCEMTHHVIIFHVHDVINLHKIIFPEIPAGSKGQYEQGNQPDLFSADLALLHVKND